MFSTDVCMVIILLVLTVEYVDNYGRTNIGYVFMIGVLSKAYQRTNVASESILRGAQQPKIGADELQKCGLGQGDLNVF